MGPRTCLPLTMETWLMDACDVDRVPERENWDPAVEILLLVVIVGGTGGGPSAIGGNSDWMVEVSVGWLLEAMVAVRIAEIIALVGVANPDCGSIVNPLGGVMWLIHPSRVFKSMIAFFCSLVKDLNTDGG